MKTKNNKFSETDLEDFKTRGISAEQVTEQLERLKRGFPFLKLVSSATLGNGIIELTPQLCQEAETRWQQFLDRGGSVCKFVPASGAASRMFKSLFAFVNGKSNIPEPGSDVAQILADIDKLPFAGELDDLLKSKYGADTKTLISQNRNKDVIAAIINPDGLNYGQLPKGLISFHRYADGTVRTPVEEQLREGAQHAASNGIVNAHFTVSDNHRDLFAAKLDRVIPQLENETGLKFNVSTSTQSPATDTVAANPDGTPFRDKDGHIVFRPGGHGALLDNLKQIDSEVVFIKNIDNIVPENHRADTIKYKKVLGGILVMAHDKIESYQKAILYPGPVSDSLLEEMKDFVRRTLCINLDENQTMGRSDLIKRLSIIFDRPLRVCGMVRNQGEPGGGPYIAYGPDGLAAPQILESTQIDTSDPNAVAMMQSATHFNPVDLVCWLRNNEGMRFNLNRYTDHNTGFISSKSFAGKELLALELPGLWNGAMSDWNTIFVEVPVTTFNPVKTVNDLLRPQHDAKA